MTRSTGNTENHQTAPRLFVGTALREGATIEASAEQAHYLGTVLRRGVRRRRAAVQRRRRRVGGATDVRPPGSRSKSIPGELPDVETASLRPQQPEAGPWLVFALLKRDATDLVVRQAVELGASRLLPVITERTNAAGSTRTPPCHRDRGRRTK
jgi:16S rRNA (uracil1498-N3)-methyltransferase